MSAGLENFLKIGLIFSVYQNLEYGNIINFTLKTGFLIVFNELNRTELFPNNFKNPCR